MKRSRLNEKLIIGILKERRPEQTLYDSTLKKILAKYFRGPVCSDMLWATARQTNETFTERRKKLFRNYNEEGLTVRELGGRKRHEFSGD